MIIAGVAGPFFAAKTTYAQSLSPTQMSSWKATNANMGVNTAQIKLDSLKANGGSSADIAAAQSYLDKTLADQKVADAEYQKARNPKTESSCFAFSATKIVTCFLASIGNVVMSAAARLLWFSGILLNYSVHYTINMKELMTNMPIVDTGWRIFRDLANIFFIFLLVSMSIGTILGLSNWNTKKMLASLIFAAVIINFSLFITQVIVDASNIVTIHFYELINPPTANNASWADSGLSDVFMNGLKIQTTYLAGSNAASASVGAQIVQQDDAGLNFWNIIMVSTFGSILIIVAAFVFFAAAIMLITRLLILMMLMVLSPIAYIGAIIPGLSSAKSRWWSEFWHQIFFAPIYMILSYIVVAAINTKAFQDFVAKGSFSEAFSGQSGSSVAIIFSYIMLIMLMLATLKVASSMGAYGAGSMNNFGKSIRKWGTGMVTGGAGYLATNRIGKLARTAADSDTAKGMKVRGSWSDRLALRTLDKVAGAKMGYKSSYDEQKKKGTFFTAGTEEVAENIKKMKPEDKMSYISNLKPELQKKAYEGLSVRDRVALENQALTATATLEDKETMRDMRNKLPLEEKEKTLEGILRNFEGKTADLAKFMTTPGNDGNFLLSKEDMEVMYKKLSPADRAKLGSELAGITATGGATSAGLSKALFDKLTVEEQEKTAKAEKEEGRKHKADQTEEILNKISDQLALGGNLTAGVVIDKTTYRESDVKNELGKVSDKQIAEYKVDTLKKLATLLKPSHIKAIDDSKEISVSDKNDIKASKWQPLVAGAGGGVFGVRTGPVNPTIVVNELSKLNQKDIASLDDEIKVLPEIIKNYELKDLVAMVEKGINKGVAQAIRQEISNAAQGKPNKLGTLNADQQQNMLDMEVWMTSGPSKGMF
jgi:hypothetical protein